MINGSLPLMVHAADEVGSTDTADTASGDFSIENADVNNVTTEPRDVYEG